MEKRKQQKQPKQPEKLPGRLWHLFCTACGHRWSEYGIPGPWVCKRCRSLQWTTWELENLPEEKALLRQAVAESWPAEKWRLHVLGRMEEIRWQAELWETPPPVPAPLPAKEKKPARKKKQKKIVGILANSLRQWLTADPAAAAHSHAPKDLLKILSSYGDLPWITGTGFGRYLFSAQQLLEEQFGCQVVLEYNSDKSRHDRKYRFLLGSTVSV